MLIVDMPMPKNCLDCNFHKVLYKNNAERCVVVCKMERKVVGKRFGKLKDLCNPSWCPIKGELVRCGECGQKKTQGNGVKFCGLHGLHYGMIITDDWFCADGERKDGEHD